VFTRHNVPHRAVPLPDRVEPTAEQSLSQAEQFYHHMKTRHSVRDYADLPVSQEVIEACIRTAGTAPSGANHQPWYFVAISDPALKAQIRQAAEAEEQQFYQGGAGDEWLKALAPIGTNAEKPHLEEAPWLIVVFAQRWGTYDDGTKFKNYYVPESVSIACGFLIAALHHAGLVSLTHTPNPMKFLNDLLGRPASEKPLMIIATGYAAEHATVPEVAKLKKSLDEICTFT